MASERERGDFAGLLRKLRTGAGLSQEALAERSLLSVDTISALERGRRRAPYRETVHMLADAMCLSKEGRETLETAARRKRSNKGTVAGAAAAEHTPKWSAVAGNLPHESTSFIGRERELSEIASIADEARLVTLVGSGGIGKSRASLQVARRISDRFPDGTWLIEIGPLRSADYLPTTIASALSITLAAGGDRAESIAAALHSKSALLVLDNCEHLIAAAAQLISLLLRRCPDVKILATSRQSLDISGEVTYRLPSLDFPALAEEKRLRRSDLERYAATALFVERARANDNHFDIRDEDAPAIAEICRRLDGIPFAIELASARTKMLAIEQIRSRLDRCFEILTKGKRDGLPRHQTLEALLDWSHDLLDEREQRLFRRMAIFANGFTLRGVMAVYDPNEPEAFETLSSLIDKSLVLVEGDGSTSRYRMLETTRLYAGEKLRMSGEHALAASRHFYHILATLQELRTRVDDNARFEMVDDHFASELEDIRVALDWSLENSAVREAGEILVSIGSAWWSVGLESEGVTRIELILRCMPPSEPRIRAQLSARVADLSLQLGRRDYAHEMARRALDEARRGDDRTTLGFALVIFAHNSMSSTEKEAALDEAERLQIDTFTHQAMLLEGRAKLHLANGNLNAAVVLMYRFREKMRSLGNGDRGEARVIAEIEHARGATSRAIAVVRETLPELTSSKKRNLRAHLLVNLAGYLASVEEYDEARMAAHDAIRELGERDLVYSAIALEHVALTDALTSNVRRAAVLAGFSEAVFTQNGSKREYTEQQTRDRLMALLSAGLHNDELRGQLELGATLRLSAAFSLAFDPEELAVSG